MLSLNRTVLLVLLSICLTTLVACSGSGSDSLQVGSADNTNEELNSLNLPTLTINNDRIFERNNPANPPVSFSVSQIEIEAEQNNNNGLVLATDSPIRVQVLYENYVAVDSAITTGLSIQMQIANYTAEQFQSDSLTENSRFYPIGLWNEVIDNQSGTATALCRAVRGSDKVVRYNCGDTFDTQGFSVSADPELEDWYLLISVFGNPNLDAAFGNFSDKYAVITSIPIDLKDNQF